MTPLSWRYRKPVDSLLHRVVDAQDTPLKRLA